MRENRTSGSECGAPIHRMLYFPCHIGRRTLTSAAQTSRFRKPRSARSDSCRLALRSCLVWRRRVGLVFLRWVAVHSATCFTVESGLSRWNRGVHLTVESAVYPTVESGRGGVSGCLRFKNFCFPSRANDDPNCDYWPPICLSGVGACLSVVGACLSGVGADFDRRRLPGPG